MNMMFIGDVVGSGGRRALLEWVPVLRRRHHVSLVIANAENMAAGSGMTGATVREISKVVDVVTTGDHVWDQKGFESEIRELDNVVRPANYHGVQPGCGWKIFRNPSGGDYAVIVLQGQVFMRECSRNPFEAVTAVLNEIPVRIKTIFVDFHAEATSEKRAMGYFLEGRATAVFGTHTHIQTADEQVLPGGTAIIADVGMVGGRRSVLGREVDAVLKKFTTGMPNRLPVVESDIQLDAAIVTYDYMTGRASGIQRISVTGTPPAEDAVELI